MHLEYAGQTVGVDADMLRLTDTWRAAGADPAKQTANWRALPGTREFADHLSATLIPGKSGDDLFRMAGSELNPSVWAYWQPRRPWYRPRQMAWVSLGGMDNGTEIQYRWQYALTGCNS